MIAIIPDIEVAACTLHVSQKTGKEYLSVTVLDSEKKEKTFCDFNVCNANDYIIGYHGALITNVEIGKRYTNFFVEKFISGTTRFIVGDKKIDEEFNEVYPKCRNQNGKK